MDLPPLLLQHNPRRNVSSPTSTVHDLSCIAPNCRYYGILPCFNSQIHHCPSLAFQIPIEGQISQGLGGDSYIVSPRPTQHPSTTGRAWTDRELPLRTFLTHHQSALWYQPKLGSPASEQANNRSPDFNTTLRFLRTQSTDPALPICPGHRATTQTCHNVTTLAYLLRKNR